jgi:hypothetical protein
MPTSHRSKRARPKLPPEVRAAYVEIEGGVKSLGKSIAEIRQGLRKAERKIEADARVRIRALREDAKAQLVGLQAREREVARTLKTLRAAAEGSWQEIKQTADAVLADARATAASVAERFRSALGA